MARMELERAEPNLTPILDMVFQLITFFMLVMNFKAASLDMNLKLPVLGSAQPASTNDGADYLVLNIDAEGRLIVYGEEKPLEPYIAQEARVAQASAEDNPGDAEEGTKPGELPVTVIIRADRATPFHLLNKVFTTCQAFGFRKFHCRVMNPQQGA